jgi:putative tryptophan/tyrosine transport system substrate-binding protein
MRRRRFIAVVGGAIAYPLVGRAQQAKLPKIGMLIPANPEPFSSVLREALRGLGYVDGQNIQYEFRSADGRPSLLPDLAAELVRLKADIIVAAQTPAVQAAKQATAEIPIVMATAGDPVGTGLIASLAHPGANITGNSATTAELGAKTLEIIREMLPSARRIAVLANATDPFTRSFLEQIESAGQNLSLQIQSIMIHRAEEFETVFMTMSKGGVDVVIVQPSLPRKQIIDLALRNRLPSVSPARLFPDEGGLMAYSASQEDMYRRAALYVDRILKGAKPADLPVEQPTKFELVINLKTAKALGITVTPSLLARADEVLE